MNRAAGTAPLIRFIARRHWLRIAIWVGSIVVLVLITAASIDGLYPTQASLDQAAAATKDNAAAIVFNGPAQALNTRGGQLAFQVGAFGLAVAGLMSVLMIGSLTRGEEESGRMEMIRSLPVGAHAPTLAAFVVVTAMSLSIGASIALLLVAMGYPSIGSVTFGLGFALIGLMFAGVTSVTAQLSENTRTAYGLGVAVLGLAYLVRAIGDVSNQAISWLSPIGLVQQAQPFAGERWLPLVLAVALTAGLFVAGAQLASRRDLGGALIPPRPGAARAGALLSSVEGLAARLHRGSLIGWTAGLAITAAAYGSIGDSVEDFVADNEAMLDMIARAGGNVDLTASFLATSFQVLCLLAAAFGIQTVLRVRSEETGLQAEPLLATPVSRARWAMSHVWIALTGSVVMLVLGGLAVGLSYGLVTNKYGRIGGMLEAAIAYVPAVWVLIGVAVVAVGLSPRFAPAAWAGLAGAFVMAMFGELLDPPQWVTNLSPVSHVPLVPAVAFAWPSFAALLAVALLFFATGLAGLRRRDIG